MEMPFAMLLITDLHKKNQCDIDDRAEGMS